MLPSCVALHSAVSPARLVPKELIYIPLGLTHTKSSRISPKRVLVTPRVHRLSRWDPMRT